MVARLDSIESSTKLYPDPTTPTHPWTLDTPLTLYHAVPLSRFSASQTCLSSLPWTIIRVAPLPSHRIPATSSPFTNLRLNLPRPKFHSQRLPSKCCPGKGHRKVAALKEKSSVGSNHLQGRFYNIAFRVWELRRSARLYLGTRSSSLVSTTSIPVGEPKKKTPSEDPLAQQCLRQTQYISTTYLPLACLVQGYASSVSYLLVKRCRVVIHWAGI